MSRLLKLKIDVWRIRAEMVTTNICISFTVYKMLSPDFCHVPIKEFGQRLFFFSYVLDEEAG